jgi:hypothetical protein
MWVYGVVCGVGVEGEEIREVSGKTTYFIRYGCPFLE